MWTIRAVLACMWTLVLAGCSYPERASVDDTLSDREYVSIASLLDAYRGYPYTFTDSRFIRGRVVSTDRYGNFYKTLAISDGFRAVEIKLDCDDLFVRYPIGSEIEVACNGLTIGSYSGVLQLGSAPSGGYETGYIDAGDMDAVIHMLGFPTEPVAASVRTVEELSMDDVSMLVALDGVQFVEAGDGTAWCSLSADGGYTDTDRYVADMSGRRLAVRTSRHAVFASWPLPSGSGRIEGILSVFNGQYQLKVVNPGPLYYSMTGARF